MEKEEFDIQHYNYHLPEEKIARYPLEKRDASRLLCWNKNTITHHAFGDAPGLIPENSMLVFNDTKVIAARLLFEKSTGSKIEIFLLQPESPTRDVHQAMTLKHQAVWECLVGNKKKWKDGTLTRKIGQEILMATYFDKEKNLIRFEWSGTYTFADIINKSGETPLPPYLKKKPEKVDAERYQTIYSRHDGAVAAPTAGLHFTEQILEKMKMRQIRMEYLTLHVSAGTFRPVESTDYRSHDMHYEQIVISLSSIENILKHSDQLIAVGTTSLRMLESLYWYGALLHKNPDSSFMIDKDLPYAQSGDISFKEALSVVIHYCKRNMLETLHGQTGIYIYPGYTIRSARGLFTNFHLPKSTLLLLVSAFTGGAWRTIYNEALEADYRFLSYGDSSLLLR